MCIKNHTHCSVEFVVERRQQPLRCRQSVNRSTGCRSLKHHTRLPRAKKKINNLPKNASPSNLPSPVYLSRHRSHRQAPIHKSSASDYCKGSIPRTSERPRVDDIKNASVEPSCHCTGTTTVVRPNQNVTYVIREPSSPPQEPDSTKRPRAIIPPPNATSSCARRMRQDYPLTVPSPGANQHTYPSSLPPARGNLLSNISSKIH